MAHPFVAGAQQMRELAAQCLEGMGDPITANAMRRQWMDAWGDDPGTPEGDPGSVTPQDFNNSDEWGPSGTDGTGSL